MPKNSRSARNGNDLVSHADIFMSIKEEHIKNIASGVKNHEYRKYLLPSSIRHIWFYTTQPTSAIQYMARISCGKEPGDLPEDGGLGNDDFNAGKKESKFGYEIPALWKLESPIPLRYAVTRGILKGPPQKYTFEPKQVCGEWELKKQTQVIGKDETIEGDVKKGEGNDKRAMTKGAREPKASIGKKKIADFFSPRAR